MTYSVKHYRHDRVYIMRWRDLFDVLNSKLSGNRRPHLINIQTDTFYL